MNSWQERQSFFCQKEKEHSHPSKLRGRQLEESQGEQEPHLVRKGSEGKHKVERVSSALKEIGLKKKGREGEQRQLSYGKKERS